MRYNSSSTCSSRSAVLSFLLFGGQGLEFPAAAGKVRLARAPQEISRRQDRRQKTVFHGSSSFVVRGKLPTAGFQCRQPAPGRALGGRETSGAPSPRSHFDTVLWLMCSFWASCLGQLLFPDAGAGSGRLFWRGPSLKGKRQSWENPVSRLSSLFLFWNVSAVGQRLQKRKPAFPPCAQYSRLPAQCNLRFVERGCVWRLPSGFSQFLPGGFL